MKPPKLSRKHFILRAAAPLAIVALGQRRVLSASAQAGTVVMRGPQAVPLVLNVNGSEVRVTLEPRTTLLDALRDRLALTGTKKGCDQGTCGACTVLVDGRRDVSCLTLAIGLANKRVTTIEGIAHGDTLHPMQAAFIEHDGFQCGYCTPGQIMSAIGFLNEKRSADEANVREWMSGNICRCGAYANIATAVMSVAESHA